MCLCSFHKHWSSILGLCSLKRKFQHAMCCLLCSSEGGGIIRLKARQGSQTELRSCVKVEVAVLGSPSLISLMVFVDVKQHWNWTQTNRSREAGTTQEAFHRELHFLSALSSSMHRFMGMNNIRTKRGVPLNQSVAYLLTAQMKQGWRRCWTQCPPSNLAAGPALWKFHHQTSHWRYCHRFKHRIHFVQSKFCHHPEPVTVTIITDLNIAFTSFCENSFITQNQSLSLRSQI